MNRRGIALLLVLLVLLITGMLAAGVLVSTSAQTRASGDARLAHKTLEAAERGHIEAAMSWNPESSLTMAIGATLGPITTTYTDTTSSLTWITRLGRGTLWISALGRSPPSTVLAPVQRRIAVLYGLHLADMRVTAALSADDSVHVAGAGTVDGQDAVPPRWSAVCGPLGPGVAGLAVPDTTRVTGKGYSGAPPLLADSAAAVPVISGQLGSATWTSLTAHATRVLSGPAMVTPAPSLTGPAQCDTAAAANWGDPTRTGACANRFVIVHARGDLTIDGGLGQGIVLGEGDVELRNGAQFFGLILARDDLLASVGPNRIWGAAIAGDSRRGNADGSVIAATSAVTYSSCAVEMSLLGSAPLRRRSQRAWGVSH